jgi:hypothetical protein
MHSWLLAQETASRPDAAQLVSVRYGVRPGCSRLTIALNGVPPYAVARQDHGVRIAFGNTTVLSAYAATGIRFSSGLIERVSFDGTGRDSAIVLVFLKAGARLRGIPIKDGENLQFEFVADQGATPASATGEGLPRKTAGTPPLDLPALTGMVAARPQGTVAGKTSGGTELPPHGRGGVPAPRLHLLLAVMLAAMGTGLALLLLRRRAVNHPPAPGPEPPAPRRRHLPGDTQEVSAGVTPPEVREAEDADMDDDQAASMLSLARQYRRGQGEMNLSFNLASRQTEQKWARLVEKLKTASGNRNAQVTLARQLGVGRGEVELALAVQRATGATPPEEELA